MKFSHKFLNTYCFILCIKKKKSKIRENWVVDMVADPLKGVIWLQTNIFYLQSDLSETLMVRVKKKI